MELRIDSDFAERIPKLTPDEFQQLEANILADGMVISPIIIWDGVIVDGHNRYRIIEKHPHIKYTTYERQFEDRNEALAWICKNQLGRRNLTLEQKRYLIGKQYESEKASHGAKDGFRGNQHTNLVTCQVGTLPTQVDTAERIAKENGIGRRSVFRAEAFSKAVDIADEVEPGIRSEILNGGLRATERDMRSLVNAKPEERSALVAELRKPPSEKAKTSKTTKQQDETLSLAQQVGEEMLTARSKGTEADLLYELEDALDSMIFRWALGLESNEDITSRDSFQEKLNQLARKGIDYLQIYIKGERSE